MSNALLKRKGSSLSWTSSSSSNENGTNGVETEGDDASGEASARSEMNSNTESNESSSDTSDGDNDMSEETQQSSSPPLSQDGSTSSSGSTDSNGRNKECCTVHNSSVSSSETSKHKSNKNKAMPDKTRHEICSVSFKTNSREASTMWPPSFMTSSSDGSDNGGNNNETGTDDSGGEATAGEASGFSSLDLPSIADDTSQYLNQQRLSLHSQNEDSVTIIGYSLDGTPLVAPSLGSANLLLSFLSKSRQDIQNLLSQQQQLQLQMQQQQWQRTIQAQQQQQQQQQAIYHQGLNNQISAAGLVTISSTGVTAVPSNDPNFNQMTTAQALVQGPQAQQFLQGKQVQAAPCVDSSSLQRSIQTHHHHQQQQQIRMNGILPLNASEAESAVGHSTNHNKNIANIMVTLLGAGATYESCSSSCGVTTNSDGSSVSDTNTTNSSRFEQERAEKIINTRYNELVKTAKSDRCPILYLPTDDDILTPFHRAARKQMHFFEATNEDATCISKGRIKRIIVGQVGIRCIYCQNIPPNEQLLGATYFPSKLDLLYQAAQHMTLKHICGKCPNVPKPIKDSLCKLKGGKSHRGGGKRYWANTAKDLGVCERDDKLCFVNR